MALENLHCPQFVDFTVQETFDINDGADFFFGLFNDKNQFVNKNLIT
jgi:hypothetical protein